MTLILVPSRSLISRTNMAGSVSGPVEPKKISWLLASATDRTRERVANTPHAGFAHDAANPREIFRNEACLRFVAVEQRRCRHAAVDQTENRAVLRRHVVNVI